MKYFLAAYDLGHRSPTGNYWVWQHRALEPALLSTALEAAKEGGFPESPNGWNAEFIKGGFCRLDENWFMAHRFYNGGYDSRGRPQRWVLLCGFVNAAEVSGCDAGRLLRSGIFVEWAARPVPLPVPPPASLEAECPDGTCVRPSEVLLQQLAQTSKLPALGLEEAAGVVAFAPPHLLARLYVTGQAAAARAEVRQKSRQATRLTTSAPGPRTQPQVEPLRKTDLPAVESRPQPKEPAPTFTESPGPNRSPLAAAGLLIKVALVSLACGIVAQRLFHLLPEKQKPPTISTIATPEPQPADGQKRIAPPGSSSNNFKEPGGEAVSQPLEQRVVTEDPKTALAPPPPGGTPSEKAGDDGKNGKATGEKPGVIDQLAEGVKRAFTGKQPVEQKAASRQAGQATPAASPAQK